MIKTMAFAWMDEELRSSYRFPTTMCHPERQYGVDGRGGKKYSHVDPVVRVQGCERLHHHLPRRSDYRCALQQRAARR